MDALRNACSFTRSKVASRYHRPLVTLSIVGLIAPSLALGQAQTRIADVNDVPHHRQTQDYSAMVNPRQTDITIGARLTYAELPTFRNAANGQQSVLFDNDAQTDDWFRGNNPPGVGLRNFTNADLGDIRGGMFHCYPTAATMITSFWAQRPGFGALARGQATVPAYIDEMALAMDTNDFNPNIRNEANKGHIGTFNSQIVPGITSFIQARSGNIAVNAAMAAFNAGGYKAEIDAGRPVFIIGRDGASSMFHGVVGIGYVVNNANGQLTNLIVRDPASENAEDTVGMPFATQNIPIQLGRRGGVRYNSEGDVAITTWDASIHDAMMFTFDFVPEPGSLVLLLGGIGGMALRRRNP